MRWKYLALFIVLGGIICSDTWAEVYQYTDENGVIRFTDDPSSIPEKQLEAVEIFESVKSNYQPETITQNSPAPIVETPADEIRADASELDQIKDDLMKEYNALQAEKESLGPPPPDNAKSGVRADYTYRVTDLNRRIDAYQQRLKEFDEKVEAFNSRINRK